MKKMAPSSKKSKCSECGKRLSSKYNLTRHMVVHKDERPFSCPNCEWTFKQSDNLKRHIQRKHPTHTISSSSITINKRNRRAAAVSNSVAVSVPSKIAGTKIRFPREERGCSQPPPTLKPNECIICGAVLKARKNLIQHMSIHLCELPFNCDFCDMAFKRKSSAASHMKRKHPNGLVQEDEDRGIFTCDLCLLAYVREDELLSHNLKKHGIGSGGEREASPKTIIDQPSSTMEKLGKKAENGQRKTSMKSESKEITGKESTMATLTKRGLNLQPRVHITRLPLSPKTGPGKLGGVSLCKSTCRTGEIGKAATGNGQKLDSEFSTPVIDFPRTRLRSGREIPRPEEVIQKRKAVPEVQKTQSIPLEEFSKMGDGNENGWDSKNSLNQAYQLDKNRVDYKFQSPVNKKTECEQEVFKWKQVQEEGLFNPPRALKMAKQVTGNETGVSTGGISESSSEAELKRTRLERWYKRHPSEVRSTVSPPTPRYVDTYVRNTAFEEQFWTCFFQDVQIFAPESINPSFNGVFWPTD